MIDKEKKKMKLVELILTDDNGFLAGDINLVSIVKGPAIEQTAMFFAEPKKYVFSDDTKQDITGPIMVADKIMLQKDKTSGEIYQCFFSKETIAKCAQLFLKNGKGMRTNVQHNQLLSTNETKGIYCSESWLVADPECDKAKALGFTAQAGDWYGTYHCEDKSLFDALKNSTDGFSIEASFFERQVEASTPLTDEETIEEIKKLLGVE
jgi:hypothetical protein